MSGLKIRGEQLNNQIGDWWMKNERHLVKKQINMLKSLTTMYSFEVGINIYSRSGQYAVFLVLNLREDP